MARSTEEIAVKILRALLAENDPRRRNKNPRRPLGILTKDLMQRYRWQELEFLQDWGLIMSDKLAEGTQQPDGFYARPTEAGLDFIRAYAFANPTVRNYKLFFCVFLLLVCVILFGVLMWKFSL